MYRNQNLVSFTVDSDGVVIVLLSLFNGRSKLDVDVLRDSRWDHTFLSVFDFKEGGLRRKDVDSLRGRGVVNQAHFQRVGLACLKPSELDYAGTGLEDAI